MRRSPGRAVVEGAMAALDDHPRPGRNRRSRASLTSLCLAHAMAAGPNMLRISGVAAVVSGHRRGSRVRTLTGTFGKTEIAVPRARLNTSDGKTTEWKSQSLRNYQRRTLAADALIAGTYLSGTNTRRCAVHFPPRLAERSARTP